MLLCDVVGTLVATKKDEKLEGLKLLVVQPVDLEGRSTGSILIAVDSVGAGVGERVLTAQGSSARQTKITEGKPVDTVIMAIVDEITVAGIPKYRK
ncbi:MAG: EutN/CcmL family microcompartment protein [Gammaproteobacteria bacterium]|nr:EutN/CcmL family microcompartment protein [Gammaproteobacteria bacterium]